MAMITLTDAERQRFADYLEQEARSDDAMAKQLETLGPAHAIGVKKFRMDAAAAMFVARRLRSIETISI